MDIALLAHAVWIESIGIKSSHRSRMIQTATEIYRQTV
jgi:hypothetical protein